MSGTKPTPGPWASQGWVPTWACIPIKDARHNLVCSLHPHEAHNYTREEAKANARLIVRAVNCHADLVDGCNALLGLFQLLCARDDAPAWLKDAFETSHRVTEAHAALAKAQGETE